MAASTVLFCGCGNDPYRYPYAGGTSDGSGSTPGPQDQSVVIAKVRPPPLSGGTLFASRDGVHALVADPDRDRIQILELDAEPPNHVVATIQLAAHSEPGRAVEDANGRAHVVLRGGGAVATFHLGTLDLAARGSVTVRPVCSAPRGIAYQPSTDRLYVACAGGELVALPADPARSVRGSVQLDRDLRDVVPWGEGLLISRFRSAELLWVAADGSLLERTLPAPYHHVQSTFDFEPAVAWRLASVPSGGAILLHQRARSSAVVLEPSNSTTPSSTSPYSGPASPSPSPGPECDSVIIHDAVTSVAPPTTTGAGPVLYGRALGVVGLAVDIAVSPGGERIAVVGASRRAVNELNASSYDGCKVPVYQRTLSIDGEPVAVAYRPNGQLLVQLRVPPVLQVYAKYHGLGTLRPGEALAQHQPLTQIQLGGENLADTGHAMFHGDPDGVAALACASCHPEGRDDGRVWKFAETSIAQGATQGAQPRRTQSLAHGIDGTAPFHWQGDLANMHVLVDEVMVGRMGRAPQSDQRILALASWLEAIPRPSPEQAPSDVAQVARGEAVFHDPNVGCSDCHTGPKLTNNKNEDVGTGGEFQVPPLLGVVDRAPYLHDGCAPTLRDRFGPCGGGDHHGQTSRLGDAQIDDLVAYLETL
jgi:cytochrome c553